MVDKDLKIIELETKISEDHSKIEFFESENQELRISINKYEKVLILIFLIIDKLIFRTKIIFSV